MAHNRLSNIRILVGLGNPGNGYGHTYHNAGRLFVDHLLEASPQPGAKFLKPSGAKNFEYLKAGEIAFVRPLCFMNESGAAVRTALKFFNAKPEDLLVVHDDSDIGMGTYKISFGRGAGGHRGAESVMQNLKTKNFWRLRIGVRRRTAQTGRGPTQTDNFPRESALSQRKSALREKAGEFVLKKITPADEKTLGATFRDIQKKFFKIV